MLTGKLEVDSDRRYSFKEAAKALGICRTTLDKLVKTGQIQFNVHVPTGKNYITGSELQRFYNWTI